MSWAEGSWGWYWVAEDQVVWFDLWVYYHSQEPTPLQPGDSVIGLSIETTEVEPAREVCDREHWPYDLVMEDESTRIYLPGTRSAKLRSALDQWSPSKPIHTRVSPAASGLVIRARRGA